MGKLGKAILAAFCFVAIATSSYSQSPPAPTDLTAKLVDYGWGDRHDSQAFVALGWQISQAEGSPHLFFRVYRSVDDSVSFSKLSTTGSQSYADHDVQSGHTYYYYVTAVLSQNDTTFLESTKSNIASVLVPVPHAPATGTVVGKVTDSLSGNPIAYARIRFFRYGKESDRDNNIWTDTAGQYKAVLDTGTYLIDCQPPFWSLKSMTILPPFRGKWYKDASEPSGATPVAVADSQTFTANFALVRFVIPTRVHVRGTVRDSAGGALGGAMVLLLRTVQDMSHEGALGGDWANPEEQTFDIDDLGCVRGVLGKVWTDSTGAFDASAYTGKSYVALAEKKGYIPQFFDHKSQPADATIIVPSGDTSGIDFNLNLIRPPQRYSVSGEVKDSSGNTIPSRIIVFPLRPHPEHAIRFGSTDSLGKFTVSKVPAGKYIVKAIPYALYAPAFYKAGAFGVLHWKDADTVTVSSDVTGIDIGVVKISSTGTSKIEGTVSSNGAGVAGMDVFAQLSDGSIAGYTLTDNSGAYEIDGLPPGSLTLIVDGEGFNSAQANLSFAPSDFTLARSFAVDVATTIPGSTTGTRVPQVYELGQNYPNPFNPTTTIRFGLPVASTVTMRIYNLLGQQIATLLSGQFAAGVHQTIWDGRDSQGRLIASGVYFYRLEATSASGDASFSQMKRMLMIK